MTRRTLVALVSAIVFVLARNPGVRHGVLRDAHGYGRARSCADLDQAADRGQVSRAATFYIGQLERQLHRQRSPSTARDPRQARRAASLSTGRVTVDVQPARPDRRSRLIIQHADVEHPYRASHSARERRWNFKEIFASRDQRAAAAARIANTRELGRLHRHRFGDGARTRRSC